MKEYEIHTTATYTTDGGTTEGSYFVEYVTAKTWQKQSTSCGPN